MLNANPTKVVLLKNMFDPSGADETSDPRFFDELKEDVMEECGKYDTTKSVAGAKIDRNSAGHVYMAFTDADGAKNCLTSLNGRWFAGSSSPPNTARRTCTRRSRCRRYGGARGRRGAHSEGPRGKGGGRGAIWGGRGGGARCANGGG